MAKYTYSFSCTIKYRFDTEQDDPENPIFDNSAFLYTCQSDMAPKADLAEMTGIKIVLPEYLQGTEEGVAWYSTKDYNAESKILGNKELDISLWTLDNTKPSQVGTFVSYELSIYLYSNTEEKTINWTYLADNGEYLTLPTNSRQQILTTPGEDADEPTKEAYKNFYNSFILINAPKIPTVVSVQKTDTLTLYTFNTWTVTRNKDNNNNYTNTYSIEAQYKETSFPASLPYTKDSKDPFADAEPYHYGRGTPPEGYFLPIGDDEDPTTSDIKAQAAENNGYSTIKKLDGFKIKGKSIQYIEKGTFPLPQLLVGQAGSSCTHAGDYYNLLTPTESACCVLSVEYSSTDNNITEIRFHRYTVGLGFSLDNIAASAKLMLTNHSGYCDSEILIAKEHANFTAHGHPNEFPKRLGFILTGGGGGAGGWSRIDPKSDGKNNDYSTPGGGGGGAETVCGVFDLTKPTDLKNDEILAFVIYLGNGGQGGSFGVGDPDHNNPALGTDGKDGYDSVIWRTSYKLDGKAADGDQKFKDVKDLQEIYRVCGGFGGGKGTASSGGSAGKGGSYKGTYPVGENRHGCWLCQQIPGGAGGTQTGESTTTNEALEMTLYFSATPPPETAQNENKFYIQRKHAAIQSTHNSSNLSRSANVAGGHSFGQGGTANQDPVNGGGGSCRTTLGGSGAGGYFGLYY